MDAISLLTVAEDHERYLNSHLERVRLAINALRVETPASETKKPLLDSVRQSIASDLTPRLAKRRFSAATRRKMSLAQKRRYRKANGKG